VRQGPIPPTVALDTGGSHDNSPAIVEVGRRNVVPEQGVPAAELEERGTSGGARMQVLGGKENQRGCFFR